jgi:hypothetical protein
VRKGEEKKEREIEHGKNQDEQQEVEGKEIRERDGCNEREVEREKKSLMIKAGQGRRSLHAVHHTTNRYLIIADHLRGFIQKRRRV